MLSVGASKDYWNKGQDMANGFDFANIGQMFGPGMGATPTGIDALLNEEQRRLLGRNAALSAAAALLQAGAPSRTPVNLGQALGSALQAGQAGYQQARAGALQDVMLNEKMKEAQQAREARERYQKFFSGEAAPTGLTPAQAALAAPTAAAGPVGPTQARAAMAAQMPTQAPSLMQTLTPEQRALLGSMKPEQGIPELLKMSSAMTEYGEPKSFMVDGKRVAVQFNKMGQMRVLPNVAEYQAPPADIQATEYILGRSLTGTGQEGMQQVGQYRQQIAPKTKVDVKLPPGPNEFVTAAGGVATKRLEAGLAQAEAANNTLRNIDMIVPALDTAVLGPGADYRTAMLRIGQQLGITGPDSARTLASTRQVVQGLARAEMDASAGMRGQGEISQSERALIARTAAGDQTMTPGELRTAMAAMQKLAQQRIKDYSETLRSAQTIPGFGQISPMFQFNPYQAQTNLGGNLITGGEANPLVNSIEQELRRRQGGR